MVGLEFLAINPCHCIMITSLIESETQFSAGSAAEDDLDKAFGL